MERRIQNRIWVLIGLIVLLMGVFAATIYKMQLQTEATGAAEGNTYTYATRVKAARGNILDRNGKVLVTNRASYDLMLTNYVLFNGDDPNGSLLELAETLQELGVEQTDHLPVSSDRPYSYDMESLSETWRGYFKTYLRENGWDGDISAENLMREMRDNYNFPDEWTDEQVRLVAGMRYELSLRYIVNIDAYRPATDLTAEQMGTVSELDIPGLTVEPTAVREYATPYAAHILGRTGPMDADEYEYYKDLGYAMDAQVGKEGLEQAFEEQLHGVDGTRLTKVDQDGNVLEQYYDTTPQAGDNVYLTIDIDLQQAAEEALEDLILDLRENGVDGEEEGKDAEGGAMVVMDVNTGEVLASASYPTYDPATYSQDFNELLQTEYSPLLNRVLQLTYFPGSIYKMITAIAAVDYGGIGRYYEIRDKGVYTYYDSFQPKCHIYTSSGTTHGVVNMMQALSVSCNYYFYEVGRLTGIDAIDAVAAAFGLGEKTGVELPEEAGQRANPQTKKELYPDDPVSGDWYGADTLQAAIGQSENKFTPIQLASYISTLANGGTRYQATFLSKVVSSDYKQVLEEQTAQVLGQVEYSEQAHLTVEEGMRMAAQTGTASAHLRDYPVPVSAKTGTAQHGGEGSDHASFACYAPSDDAQIAIVIYVEKGAQGGNLGKAARAVLDVYFGKQEAQSVEILENAVH